MAEPHMRTPDVSDFELERPPDMPGGEPPPPRVAVWWIVAAGLIVVTVGIYLATSRRAAAPVGTAVGRAGANTAADRPLGYNADRIDLPPLDETDPLVRNLVKQISSHPSVAAWLTSDRLIRNFTAVVANVAEGPTPAVHLRVLRPTAGFKVIDRGNGRLTIDPHSYERYDAFAAAASSIDPAGAARLYATLRPRIEEAHRDLGSSTSLDRTLEQAIVSLLKTPVVADPIAVRPEGGTGYAFTDPALESLTPAQKQLLRTGSANVRTIQASLRAIALALGIPAERLPAAAVK